MTRDKVLQDVLDIQNNNILLELPTGFGKTRLSIEKIKSYNIHNLLIVVNRLVHIENWKEELTKWWSDSDVKIEFVTYASLHKKAGKYDAVIFDEAHHLSERCRDLLKSFDIKYSILLSATINRNLKYSLNHLFNNLYIYSKTLRDSIDNKILPDPFVYFIKLELKSDFPTEAIYKNKASNKRLIECNYKERWSFIKQKEYPVKIYCTEEQYYSDLCSQIDYWQRRYNNTHNIIAKRKYLRLCLDRLLWLSNKKTPIIKELLKKLYNYRTLTFCNSINQTEKLGKYCINSKNKESKNNIKLFNDKKIKHITACNILNESMNLKDCKIGIYANLNSSDIIVLQRTGRLLRHKEPIIIIFYYANTREEELIDKMKQNYNKNLIKTVNSIDDIKICR